MEVLVAVLAPAQVLARRKASVAAVLVSALELQASVAALALVTEASVAVLVTALELEASVAAQALDMEAMVATVLASSIMQKVAYTLTALEATVKDMVA